MPESEKSMPQHEHLLGPWVTSILSRRQRAIVVGSQFRAAERTKVQNRTAALGRKAKRQLETLPSRKRVLPKFYVGP